MVNEISKKFLIMHENDNCATSLDDIPKATEIEINGNGIKLNQNIPLGHKFALFNLKQGQMVIKYGEPIGVATEDINVGDWIHTHNLKSYYLEAISK